MDLALGAGAALAEFIPEPRERLKRAVGVAIEFDVDCPGELLVQSFDRGGVLAPARVEAMG